MSLPSAFASASELSTLLSRREISSVELTRASLSRIAEHDQSLGAFLLVTEDVALRQAEQADKRIKQGERGALLGIPMALKDILSTNGIRTTCGSKMLKDYVPQYNATVVQRLDSAGAVLLGKTNMDEFAMGSSNENSAFGSARNPWDVSRVPGGSSGGSAVAVAAGESVFALGTDTGGSIRQPASFTGTVGLKPTYGRVSRLGLVAFASSLDQVGPITRSVEDAANVLSAIAGHDPGDSTSLNVPVPDFASLLGKDIAGLRLGVPREYFGGGMTPGVEGRIRAAVNLLSSLGAETEEVSLPHTDFALSTYYIVSPSEAMANLARYDGVRYGFSSPDAKDIWELFSQTREEGFGTEVKRRILLGTYCLSAGYYDAYYVRAQRVRTLVRRDFEEAFKKVDALIAPTAPTVAFRLGEKTADPLAMYLSDVYTVPASMAGICAISVPCGLSDGLPVGLQILGKPFDEATVLRVAFAFERAAKILDRPTRFCHG